MDTNDKIVGVVFVLNKEEMERLIGQGVKPIDASHLATMTAIVFKEDVLKHEIINLNALSSAQRASKVKNIIKKADMMGAEKQSFYNQENDPRITAYVNRAINHQEYLSIEARKKAEQSTIKQFMEKNSKRMKKAALTVGLAGALALTLTKCDSNGEEQQLEKAIETQIDEADYMQGYGYYKFDLSKMEDMSEYSNAPEILNEAEIEAKYGIKGVAQKDRSLLRLSILEQFNNEITLVDGKTKQLGGLTIEQLVALDAYCNSNIYEAEDYIKNFGLYNFSSITDDFQQATLAVGAYLANPEVDGSALADIFQDEEVKENYLKQLDFRDRILNAETKSEQNKIVDDYVEFLSECSINQASDQYLDYDQHPGMAFVTSAIVNSLTYHNIVLNKDIVSEIIIIGSEQYQSKLNSICADAQAKLDAAANLADNLKDCMTENYNITIDNEKEIKLAEQEGREPVLKELYYPELYTLIREVLCDQNQINDLTNKTLEKAEKLVTEEDQKIILANGVNIQVELLNSGKGGYYKDAHTAQLAEQLQKKDDTVTETQKGVTFTTPEQVRDFEAKEPEKTQAAKDEYNKENGTIANSTPEEQKQAQEQIDNDIKNTEQEGLNYYNKVMSYYETHGNVDGIPAELQDAYNNLGADTFNMAKQTGFARYMTNEENKNSGGGINIDSDYDDAEISDKPQDPVESVDNTTPPSQDDDVIVVPPEENQPTPPEVNQPTPPEENQPVPPTDSGDNNNQDQSDDDINWLPGFDEDIEYDGDLIIGDPTNVPESNPVGEVAPEIPTDINSATDASNNPNNVVDSSNVENYVDNIDSIIENMTDEEWAAFIDDGITYEDMNQKTR